MDDVAEVDADAQQHPPVGGNVEVALGHDLLHGDGAFDCAHGAWELRHNPVARDIDDASAMLGDHRKDCGVVRFEVAHRFFFIAAHQPRIAGDVRSQNGGEATLVGMEALLRLGPGVFHATLVLLRGQPGMHSGGAFPHPFRTDSFTQL